MFGKKRQVIKADFYNNDMLFLRVSDVVTKKDAIIEIPSTHNALIIKGGGDIRFYKSGTYEAFDNKDEIKQWKQGCSVEVIYMPKDVNVKIRWGTRDRLMYRDVVSGKVVTVGAKGISRISITNPMQFNRKVVGALKKFDIDAFIEEFRTDIVFYFTDAFLSAVTEQGLTYEQFDAKKLAISAEVEKILNEKFDKSWGISLVDFMIEKCDTTEEDQAKVEEDAEELRKDQKAARERARLREYLAEIERLEDRQWEKEKYLKQIEKEDNLAYYEVLKAIGSKDVKGSKGANFCPKCGHTCESTADFCPNCGQRLGKGTIVCPDCKKENPSDSTFCSGCGRKLK